MGDPCPTCGHQKWSPPIDCCISCGIELTPVSDGLNGSFSVQQYNNALDVTFTGGYGEFFDGGIRHVFLCHDCAHTACDTLPWLNELIKPAHSHAHHTEYWAEHPDHDGWDKK